MQLAAPQVLIQRPRPLPGSGSRANLGRGVGGGRRNRLVRVVMPPGLSILPLGRVFHGLPPPEPHPPAFALPPLTTKVRAASASWATPLPSFLFRDPSHPSHCPIPPS